VDLSPFQPGRLPGGTARPLGVGQRGSRVRKHRPAHGGEPDRSWHALQQPPAHGRLQRPDLVRQRGLGHVQQLGRTRERPFVDDGDQVFELPQTRHELSLWMW
jgi:hypothetical protein